MVLWNLRDFAADQCKIALFHGELGGPLVAISVPDWGGSGEFNSHRDLTQPGFIVKKFRDIGVAFQIFPVKPDVFQMLGITRVHHVLQRSREVTDCCMKPCHGILAHIYRV